MVDYRYTLLGEGGRHVQGLEALLGRALQVPINSDSLTPNNITGNIAPWKNCQELMGRAWEFKQRKNLPSAEELVLTRVLHVNKVE
jgi:hypothetical protein